MTLDTLYGIARRMARNGAINDALVDDIVQDVVVALAEETFDGRGNEEAFVLQRMKWRMIDAMRNYGCFSKGRGADRWKDSTFHSRNLSIVGTDCYECLEEDMGVVIAESPEEEEEDTHSRLDVERILMALPEREALVLRSLHFAGKTMVEIGISLGLTEARISQIHTRALRRAQKHLAA